MSSSTSRTQRSDLAVVALISCAMLMYEILLTRVSALRLLFHYSYLVVSNCLLGLGAAGTYLTLRRGRFDADPERGICGSLVWFFVSVVLVYPFVLLFPIWSSPALASAPGILRFSLFNLGVAVPFFFAGLAIAKLLTCNAGRVNLVYGFDLLGAAVGCVLLPVVLRAFGAGGSFILIALLGAGAAVLAAPAAWRRWTLVGGVAALGLGVPLLPYLDRAFPVPGKGVLQVTRFVKADLRRALEFSKWTLTSRIDMISVPDDGRFIFTRGAKTESFQIPPQKMILQDGSAFTYIGDWSGHPEMLDLLRHCTYSAAQQIKPSARVFVIGFGGGNDVWAAKVMGARSIKGIELNQPTLNIHRGVMRAWSKGLLDDPSITLAHGEGRSALMRDREKYDAILMSGIDTWTALASGAYMLAENYLYTTEAVESMWDHLDDGGVIQIIRMAADMETLRLLSNVQAALTARGIPDFQRSVAALATPDSLVAVLVKRGGFTANDVETLKGWAATSGITPVYLPGYQIRSRATEFVLAEDKVAFIRAFPRNLTPTTDDSPYFFNYTKWKNPFAAASYLKEPDMVSQGNPVFILSQLVLSLVLGIGLIVLPLARGDRAAVATRHAWPFLGYFAGLGAGFIAVEIVTMQKLTLFLGHPSFSVTVTLFSMLLFTGLGSLASRRWFERNPRRMWGVPAALAVTVGSFALVSPAFVAAFIGLPVAARIALTVAVLAPVGFLLGVPFAYGLRRLEPVNPTLVPWAWAVNGCCTVVGSILTVVLSMNFGFNVVLATAIVIYFGAFAALAQVKSGEGSTLRATSVP